MNKREALDCGSGCRGFDPRHSPRNPAETPGRGIPQGAPGAADSTGYSSDSVQDLVAAILPRADWAATGRVYFIGCGEFVKIGFSDRLHDRFSGLQGATPYELEVLVVLEGAREFEQELHARFAGLRHRREWFLKQGPLAELVSCPAALRARAKPERPSVVAELKLWVAEFDAVRADPARQAALREECRLALVQVGR